MFGISLVRLFISFSFVMHTLVQDEKPFVIHAYTHYRKYEIVKLITSIYALIANAIDLRIFCYVVIF